MSISIRRIQILLVSSLLVGTAAQATAQSLGTFRWQQQPYCNVLTLNVVQSGAIYQLDGFDDQCGAPTRASVVGIASPNPDGSVGMGLTLVTTPGGTPLHIDVALSLATISGTWRDSAGATGPFVFTPGAGAGGSARPTPRAAFPGGLSIGGATITNLATPVAASDAATKGYVDGGANLVVPVANGGAAVNFVFPAPQLTLGSSTFTTPKAGHLLVSMNVTGNLMCTTAFQSYWWIEVDGSPIRSSLRTVGEGEGFDADGLLPFSISGLTAASVAAGVHTVSVRGACSSGPGSFTFNSTFSGYVTVLDAGYASRAMDAAPPLDGAGPPSATMRACTTDAATGVTVCK